MTTNELDFLNIGADLNEMAVDAGGFRKVQHFNPNHTLHAKTSIADGGYGIKNELGDAPALKNSKVETIKHQGGRQTIFRTTTELDVALIGWTSKYWVCEYDDPATPGKRVSNITADYFKPEDLPGTNAKCRQCITFFIVLHDDPERQLWAIDFRGFNVQEAEKLIFSAKALANDVAKRAGVKVAHPFVHWLTMGVGESKLVGKQDQSLVCPPVWTKDGDNIRRAIVSKDDYAKFVDLRRELDAFLPTSRYAVRNTAPALNAPTNRPALNAPANGYRPLANGADEGDEFNG